MSLIKKRLYRGKDRMVAGVCSGIAEYFDADPTVIRLIWALLTIMTLGLGGIFAYLIAWVIMPER